MRTATQKKNTNWKYKNTVIMEVKERMTYVLFFGILLMFGLAGFLDSYNRGKKEENKFLYRVDPKQDHYLIENNNGSEKRLDTVPFGHLEEYIVTDNL